MSTSSILVNSSLNSVHLHHMGRLCVCHLLCSASPSLPGHMVTIVRRDIVGLTNIHSDSDGWIMDGYTNARVYFIRSRRRVSQSIIKQTSIDSCRQSVACQNSRSGGLITTFFVSLSFLLTLLTPICPRLRAVEYLLNIFSRVNSAFAARWWFEFHFIIFRRPHAQSGSLGPGARAYSSQSPPVRWCRIVLLQAEFEICFASKWKNGEWTPVLR